MIYVFHDYALDTDCFELRHAGIACKLAPKVFNLLQYLIEHRERVVPRDELLEQLWPEQNVTDSSLNHCAMEARKALNDGGEAQQILQTVRHRGYRFIAPVAVQQSSDLVPTASLPLPPALARGLSATFHGRPHELTVLAERFAQVQLGHGHVVALVGPPGIGKSRLLQEFCQQYVQPTDTTYIRECCPFYARLRPFWLVRTVLQQCSPASFTPAMLATEVQQLCATSSLPLHAATLVLTALCGQTDSAELRHNLDPEVAQEHLDAALGHLVLCTAQRQPLVLILEDVQWIDASSASWLQWLLEQTANAPLFLLLSYRPEYQPWWQGPVSWERIVLPPLSTEESRRLVHTVLPPHDVAPHVVQEVLSTAQGNPLALILLAHTVLAQVQTSAPPAVPETMSAALLQCLDHLSPAARRLLHAAAVLDGAWDMSLLAAAWDGAGEVSTSVRELQQGGWRSQSPPGTLYPFTPTIFQETLYATLHANERQYWHRRLGNALQALAGQPEADLWERLAYHYAAAEESTKAPDALLQAANQAAQQHAYGEAIALSQEALRQGERLVEPQHHREWCCRVRVRLARLLHTVGRYAEALTLLANHQEAHSACRDAVSTHEWFLLLSQLSSAVGDWQRAGEQARQVLTATPAPDVVTQGLGYALLAMASYWSEQHAQGAHEAREAVARLAPPACHTVLGWAYVVLGLHHLALGDVQHALEATTMVQTLERPCGNTLLYATAAWTTGAIHAVCGRTEAAITACQRSLNMAPEALTTALATGWLGYAFLEQGTVARAVECLSAASLTLHELSYPRQASLFTVFLGAAYVQQQRFGQAQDTLQQGRDLAQASQYEAGLAWAQRVWGQMALAQEDWPTAAQHLQAALGMFTRLSARLEMGRTHLLLGELAYCQHDHVTMRLQGQAAVNAFRPLQVEAYMTQAAHLLQNVS